MLLRRLLLALALISLALPAAAQGTVGGITIRGLDRDAKNAVLPTARNNLGLGTADSPAFKSLSLIGNTTAALTLDGAQHTVQNSTVTAQAIYNGMGIAGSLYDAVRGVLDLTPGSVLTNGNAIGGYLRNRSAGNGVVLSGTGTAQVDNAKTWGINTNIMDAASYVIGSGTGRILVGYEADISVLNPATIVQGISLLGSSLVQPAAANGFSVGSLSVTNPEAVKWDISFVSTSGDSNVAFYAGAMSATGANVAGQPVKFGFIDGASLGQTYSLAVDAVQTMTLSRTGGVPAIFKTGKISVNTTTTSNLLEVAGPTAALARFQSTGANAAIVQLDVNAGSQVARYDFMNAGTLKWQWGMNTDQSFFGFDNSANNSFWVHVLTSGTVILGETSQIQVPKTALMFGLGGLTSSFPALKRSAADMQVRLADDSAYATLDTLGLKVSGAAGASCTIVGATAHLTAVNGIVTLCN